MDTMQAYKQNAGRRKPSSEKICDATYRAINQSNSHRSIIDAFEFLVYKAFDDGGINKVYAAMKGIDNGLRKLETSGIMDDWEDRYYE